MRRPSLLTRVTILERLQLGHPPPKELCAIESLPPVVFASVVAVARAVLGSAGGSFVNLRGRDGHRIRPGSPGF
jgi:hypothetical protein